MKATNITYVILVANHFLQLKIWRIIFLMFMNAAKISSVNFAKNRFHVQPIWSNTSAQSMKIKELCGKSFSKITHFRYISCELVSKRDLHSFQMILKALNRLWTAMTIHILYCTSVLPNNYGNKKGLFNLGESSSDVELSSWLLLILQL